MQPCLSVRESRAVEAKRLSALAAQTDALVQRRVARARVCSARGGEPPFVLLVEGRRGAEAACPLWRQRGRGFETEVVGRGLEVEIVGLAAKVGLATNVTNTLANRRNITFTKTPLRRSSTMPWARPAQRCEPTVRQSQSVSADNNCRAKAWSITHLSRAEAA